MSKLSMIRLLLLVFLVAVSNQKKICSVVEHWKLFGDVDSLAITQLYDYDLDVGIPKENIDEFRSKIDCLFSRKEFPFKLVQGEYYVLKKARIYILLQKLKKKLGYSKVPPVTFLEFEKARSTLKELLEADSSNVFFVEGEKLYHFEPLKFYKGIDFKSKNPYVERHVLQKNLEIMDQTLEEFKGRPNENSIILAIEFLEKAIKEYNSTKKVELPLWKNDFKLRQSLSYMNTKFLFVDECDFKEIMIALEKSKKTFKKHYQMFLPPLSFHEFKIMKVKSNNIQTLDKKQTFLEKFKMKLK